MKGSHGDGVACGKARVWPPLVLALPPVLVHTFASRRIQFQHFFFFFFYFVFLPDGDTYC